MAKCLRCGKEITQPVCECGYDLRVGVRFLEMLEEEYVLEDGARREALASLRHVLVRIAEKKEYDESVQELAEAFLGFMQEQLAQKEFNDALQTAKEKIGQLDEMTERLVGQETVSQEEWSAFEQAVGDAEAAMTHMRQKATCEYDISEMVEQWTQNSTRLREQMSARRQQKQEAEKAVFHVPGRPTMIKYKEYFQNYELVRVVIPEGVTRISDRAFASCKNLEEITIPDTVTYIGEEAFYNCSKLKRIRLPRRLNTLKQYAFGNCENLEEVILPGTLRAIEPATFMDCRKLERITIPEGVTDIGSGAFSRCIALKEVELPASLQTMAHGAFTSCWDVRLHVNGTEKQWESVRKKMFWNTITDKAGRLEYKRLMECVTITRR